MQNDRRLVSDNQPADGTVLIIGLIKFQAPIFVSTLGQIKSSLMYASVELKAHQRRPIASCEEKVVHSLITKLNNSACYVHNTPCLLNLNQKN
eukprot:2565586-Pleurochrysis_carterae.AAC.2